jgi:peptidoglycan hydrolase-like protein with peptidoglycan-binding domain
VRWLAVPWGARLLPCADVPVVGPTANDSATMIEDTGNHGSCRQQPPRSELDGEPFGGTRDWRGVFERRWLLASLAGLVVLGVGLQSLLILRSDDPPQRTSLLAAQAPAFEIEMPGTGRNRLLSVAQLRWCLREDLRIEVFEQRLSYSAPQRFNVMVADYNRRCTRFKHRDDDLEHARRDIDGARKWIVEEAFAEAYSPSVSAAPAKLAAAGYSILTKDVQGLLRAVGHDPGPIDGHYGARTKAAVEAFERELDRAPTGGISEALRRELLDRVRSAGLAESRLLATTAAEAAAIRSRCASARGVTAYNRCVESELGSLAQRRPPAVRAVTAAERSAIDDACLRAKLRGGETGYDRCVEEQISELAALESEPSVAAMTAAERTVIDARCASTGSFYGPAAFYRCAQEHLAEVAAAGSNASL